MNPRPLPAKRTRVSAKTLKRTAAAERVVGYLRVSTQEQAASGLGLDAQRAAIEATCTARGWTLAAWCTDEGVSGTVPPADRPAMGEALGLLDSGSAGVLLVAKLDRCSRSTNDFTSLLDRALRDGWSFVALDLGVDTSTPVGRLVAEVLCSVAQWERTVIAQRTAAALQAKKAGGERLGAPLLTPAATRDRVRELRHDGLTMAQVADRLNADGITTATGRAWTWQNVRRVTASLALDDAAPGKRVQPRPKLSQPPPAAGQ